MIWIDFAILGLITVSLVIGLFRGLVKEAFSLVSWVIAVWIGLTFSREFAVYLEQYIVYPSARIATAFGILFLLTLILGAVVSYLLGVLVAKTGLSGSDRFAGMIFGLARGVVVVSILVMLAGLTPVPEESWWQESLLIPPFQSLALWLREQLPAGMAGHLQYQ